MPEALSWIILGWLMVVLPALWLVAKVKIFLKKADLYEKLLAGKEEVADEKAL